MHVTEAILQRHSTRAFKNCEVDKTTIQNIINIAKRAPSGVNIQPWQVAIVSGKTKDNLANKMTTAFRMKQNENMDYRYYPLEWISPFKERRIETGQQLYQALNIKKEDKERRLSQWEENYRAFNAPTMLIFFIDRSLEKGSYIDYGMFLQNIMLLAEEQGLATCPQASLGEFPSIIKSELGITEDKILLGGIALGYEDKDHSINQYRTSRVEFEQFCQFYD